MYFTNIEISLAVTIPGRIYKNIKRSREEIPVFSSEKENVQLNCKCGGKKKKGMIALHLSGCKNITESFWQICYLDENMLYIMTPFLRMKTPCWHAVINHGYNF